MPFPARSVVGAVAGSSIGVRDVAAAAHFDFFAPFYSANHKVYMVQKYPDLGAFSISSRGIETSCVDYEADAARL